MARESKQANQELRRRYGSEVEVEAITGISRRTLQKDRLFKRKRFNWYKVCGKVLYDLDEVEATIKAASGAAA
jgi:hypothetical protein